MANTFKKITATGTSAGSTIATVPVDSTWVIIGFVASNVSGVLITLDIVVAGASLLTSVPVPDGSTLGLLEGKMVMDAGDTITEVCSTDAGVDYIISYMEIT